MKAATRVTSKGQVVIPKLVREQLRWVSGTELAVEVTGDGAVRLTLLEAEDPIDALYGCLKDLPRDPLPRPGGRGAARPALLAQRRHHDLVLADGDSGPARR